MILSIETVSTARAHLWEAGFRPVPIINWDAKGPSPGKRPLGDNWRESALKDPPFCVTIPAVSFALNTGVLGDGLRPIDIDIDDPILAARVRNLAVKRFGPMPTRTRANSARALLLCRAAAGQPRKVAVTGATHTRERGCKVEVLGAGQQFVALGRHDSGAELLWHPPIEEITLADLPAITEPDIMAYLAEVAIIIDATPPGYTNGRDHYDATEPQADALRVIAALAAIPNNGPADWEGWNRIGMAIWAATGGSAIGGEAFNEWSRRHPAYDAAATLERWRHYQRSPPTQIGAGTLFHMAGGTFHPVPPVPETGEPPPWVNEAEPTPNPDFPDPAPQILTLRQFMDTFTIPDYLIEGIIQRARLYALTAPTGHGKTAVALFLACMMATGRAIGALEVTQANVLFLAGENPDDLCGRIWAACQAYDLDPDETPIHVMPGNFPMTPEAAELLRQKIDALGQTFGLIIGDSLAAYFPGDDENHNVQMGAYARNWRVLTGCRGKPAVLALAHPIKNPSADQLLPRGGGAFMAELDANLTLWAEGERTTATLHWQGKIRGTDFQPVTLGLTPVIIADKTDRKGRHFVSVVATLQTTEQAEKEIRGTLSDENTVLEWLRRNPGISVADIAMNAGWISSKGTPAKSKVHRLLSNLKKDNLVRMFRKKWRITETGEKELERGLT